MLLAVFGVVGVAVTAIAGDEAEAVPAKTIASATAPPETAPAPPLLPMPTAVDTSSSGTSLSDAVSSDAPLLIAAVYWLLLAGVALRRIITQREQLAT